MLLSNGLQELGYTVLTACDGPEALELCGGDVSIDLLFTDIIMPGMNGRELMEQLTARRPGLTTLFMSGYTDDVLESRGVRVSGHELPPGEPDTPPLAHSRLIP